MFPRCGNGSLGKGSAAQPALDGVHQHAGNGDVEGRLNLADAGRAGDVNLGQAIADDVEADEDEPLRCV